MKGVTRVWGEAKRHLARKDAAFVADLGIALANQYGCGDSPMWQYRNVLDQLLRLLAGTPGADHVEQALRLVTAAASADRKPARYAASLLAASQSPEHLVRAFAGRIADAAGHAGAPEELRACLVHEMVLRGVAVERFPEIVRWADSPHWSRHPLHWLPLSLSSLEDKPPLPRYTVDGSSCALPCTTGGPAALMRGRPWVPAATETTSDAAVSALASAVVNWADESNGRIEARTYDLAEPPPGAEAVPALLRGLGLECLDGLDSGRGLGVSSCRPAHAWRVLFAAASAGGAYNYGAYGAYGRLAAWQSLAALCGTADDAPFDAVEQRAQQSDWYGFGADTPWFGHVAWDIGLVALHSERRLTVLAATDTD